MPWSSGSTIATLLVSGRIMLTSLPEGVVEMIINHLHGNDKVSALPIPLQNRGLLVKLKNSFGQLQAHLALCCKALLPILGMGHVRVNLDAHKNTRPLLNANRGLRKQPNGASHLHMFSFDGYCGTICFGTRRLIDLRCAHAPCGAGACMVVAAALAAVLLNTGWGW